MQLIPPDLVTFCIKTHPVGLVVLLNNDYARVISDNTL